MKKGRCSVNNASRTSAESCRQLPRHTRLPLWWPSRFTRSRRSWRPSWTSQSSRRSCRPKRLVQRGLKVNEEYNIFAGENYIGRADEKPVDIDLTFQEPEDRVWVSRQHALVVFDDATGVLTVEDLNSANGTFVNRERVYP